MSSHPATGWISNFELAIQTRHRVVLHGNVLDFVLDGSETLPLSDWVIRRLRDIGFVRILRYNYGEEARAIHWDGASPEQAQVEFRRPFSGRPIDFADNPSAALRVLGQVLRDGTHKTAVIIQNSEYRFSDPTLEAVFLRQLTRESADGTAPQGLVVHLYSTDRIPPDFIRVDPDTAVVWVTMPTFEERQSFFQSLPTNTALLQMREHGVPLEVERLARITEGYRLREIQQLVELARNEPAGSEISSLLSLFRHGRKLDYWANQQIPDIRRQIVERVKGQDSAIEQVVDSLYIAKHRVGLLIDTESRTPAMVLFFVGATGVGKTLMARAICQAVTGTEENLKRFDMSEFQREHTDQRLIGSPPGYVGYGEGGQLTNWVLSRPCSVVLIDEVEKAHERILDIFLQILEGARLTDGKGATVDMSDTILIFTSNIGAAVEDTQKLDKNERRVVVDHFMREVERYFSEDLERPELYNRLKKGIIVFDYVSESNARAVIESRLKSIAESVSVRCGGALRIDFDPAQPSDREVVDKLLGKTRFTEYGLRDVSHTLLQAVGVPIGKFLDDPGRHGRHSFCFRWNSSTGRIRIIPSGP